MNYRISNVSTFLLLMACSLSASADLTLNNGANIDMDGSTGSTIIFPDGSIQSTAQAGTALPTGHGGSNNTVSGTGAVVGGGRYNDVSADYGTIGGGGPYDPDSNPTTTNNRVTDDYGTIGGGGNNQAGDAAGDTTDATYATVAGGRENTASGYSTTVSGGWENTASGSYATVAGGYHNMVSGNYATVAGGWNNTASGYYSFAAGKSATATHNNSFVWGDSDGGGSSGINTFTIHADGGIYFNGGAVHNSSDRNLKEGFTAVNAREVLDKVIAMPITNWRFKSEDDTIEHIGPVAQDFMATFGYGNSDKHITSTDADGVALAAIQGLHELLEEKQTQIDTLEKQRRTQNDKFIALEKRLLAMEIALR